MKKEPLLPRLRAALQTGKGWAHALKFDSRLPTLEDATGLCEFLAEQANVEKLIDTSEHGKYKSPLYYLVMVFQEKCDDVTREHLRKQGLPELARLCDLALAQPDIPDHPMHMMAKMFALYSYEPGIARVAAIARRFPDGFMLSPSFRTFGDPRHPHGAKLIEHLRDPLPTGFAAVLTLDLANTLCREGRLEKHPFDTSDGYAMLEAWLTDADPRHFSYAISSAASLPFIGEDIRNRLAAIAMDHPGPSVQMEAAWASAYRGSEAGLKFLARMAGDTRQAITAQRYLKELGRTDVIPEEAQDPDFLAMAEMSHWLAHPNEFGRAPDEISVYDTRELFWPPTKDKRQLWLIRYRFAASEEGKEDEVGIGMVGSTTFALFGEATADLCPEDIYGLHCCWELRNNGDPRASERTAQAGRNLLGI